MNRLNLSIRDEKDLKDFVMSIIRREAFENPKIYKRAFLTTVKALGFDEEWVKTDLANEFDHIIKINEMADKIKSINNSTNKFYDAENIKRIIKILLEKKVYVSDIYHTWDNIPFTCKILDKDEFECLKHTCPDYRLIVEAYDEYEIIETAEEEKRKEARRKARQEEEITKQINALAAIQSLQNSSKIQENKEHHRE